MTLLFGNLMNQFVISQAVVNKVDQGDQQALDELPAIAAAFHHVASKDAIYFVVIGISILVCTYFYMYVWVYTAEVNTKHIHERYLQAVLCQDILFFYNVGAGEVATQIQADTHEILHWPDLVQQGMLEKVPLVMTFLSSFVTGFVLAYIWSWRLTFALMSLLPCIGNMGALMNKFISKFMQYIQ
ncbi:ABC transporter type 1, transmembrane domain-containing protein [Armillaria novae-zelandiae]|uniref:ABC transporter type 1, transmembrane domain-containing protein n=1 Tax=Armillaria novae-zelandiae TaxID=153914 RepID=A0AA39TXW7_9AGAR|nr:ABC transporter type 1, transmembrane domain-containing protein [Armillaria novae-zelandiae]